jgi:hypothetical protein
MIRWRLRNWWLLIQAEAVAWKAAFQIVVKNRWQR